MKKQNHNSTNKNRKTKEKTRKITSNFKKSKTSKKSRISKREKDDIAKTIKSYLETSKKENRTAPQKDDKISVNL